MMKYYPIGTVVTLVNGNRPLMIYGRKQIQNESDILWDYVACFYPKEIWGTIIMFSFNTKKSTKSFIMDTKVRLMKLCSRR